MRKILLVLGCLAGILLFPGKVQAQQQVHEIAISSYTVFTITISSGPTTQVDSPALSGRFAIEVQNQSATQSAFCGEKSGLTSSSNSRKIAPGGSLTLHIRDVNTAGTSMPIYCVHDGASGTITLAVTQLR